MVTAGLAEGRDAILVIDTGDARPLSVLGANDVDEATLARIWKLDAGLFRARIAHGQLFVANREGGCIGEYTLSWNFCKAQLSKHVALAPVQVPASPAER